MNGPLHDYYKLEKYLEAEEKYGYWSIFRLPFIQQFFYFWANMVENGVLGLPLSKADLLYDANIQDICECLAQATLSKSHMVWSTNAMKRVYELRCGPLTFEMIVSELSNALRESDGELKVKAITLTDDQFIRYLEYMSAQDHVGLREFLKTIQVDGDNAPMSITTRKTDLSTIMGHKDGPSVIPSPSDVITPFFIDSMMDYMKMIRGNQPLSVVPTHDIRDLTGKEPIYINKFFTSNLRRFRPGY